MLGRLFDDARKQQGFRNQEHLDAFFSYYDHVTTCAECAKPGPLVFVDDGCQPTHYLCEVARKLDRLIK
jgi:hypothetical protein